MNEGGFKLPTQTSPTDYDLQAYELRTYPPRGSARPQMRYRELKKNLLMVELWLEYQVKNKGILGRSRSVLVARYHMRRVKLDGSRPYQKIGKAEVWHFNGKRKSIHEFVPNKDGGTSEVYSAQFNEDGLLTSFEDKTRGENNARIAKYARSKDGTRTLQHWRGRYYEKSFESNYNGQGGTVIRRNDGGAPLDDNGDYASRIYREDGALRDEEHYVAGKKHGFERAFNKFGRVISEKYWHHGVEVPDWVYLDPVAVTPEEITGEEDSALRDVMLELQGKETFQIRMMARSMKAVVRTRITDVGEEMSAAPIVRPKLTEV